MNLYKFLFLVICVPIYAHAVSSDEFSKTSSHPYEHKWEGHALLGDEEKIIEKALFQTYHYLNAGTHSIAFLSQDGQYILKFFKKKRFVLKEKTGFFIPFYTSWRQGRKSEKLSIKRDRIFSAYKISCDRLSKETGVLHVHFNSTGHFAHSLTLTDSSGKPFSIALDDWDFVLEKRAEPLSCYLEKLLHQGDIEKAGRAIAQLLDLHRVFFHKGMRNRDIEFVNNYGFVDGAPVLFDVDRLLPCTGQEGREKYQKKLTAFLPAFHNWIAFFYPVLLPFCDDAIAKIQATFPNDPDELSMTCFHPYHLKWDGHALIPQEKNVLEKALCQPYRYLSKGGQSFVFLSEDGNYVIKFFKQKIFSIPHFQSRYPFLAHFLKERKIKQRAAKRDRIFSGYKIAFDKLAKETGVLYVHFNATSHLQKTLQLTLPSGQALSVDLDDCDFIVERRAECLQDHLNALLAQDRIYEAGDALRRLLELYCVFYQKDVRDRDVEIANNYGFVDGAPVLFDAGRLLPCVGHKDKKKYQKRIQSILPSFRNWVKAHYPMLIPYCDGAIAKIIETIYSDSS